MRGWIVDSRQRYQTEDSREKMDLAKSINCLSVRTHTIRPTLRLELGATGSPPADTPTQVVCTNLFEINFLTNVTTVSLEAARDLSIRKLSLEPTRVGGSLFPLNPGRLTRKTKRIHPNAVAEYSVPTRTRSKGRKARNPRSVPDDEPANAESNYYTDSCISASVRDRHFDPIELGVDV